MLYFTTAACIQKNWQQTSHQTVLLERYVHLVLVVWRLCSSVWNRKSVDRPDDFRYDESVDDKWYFLGSRRLYIVKAAVTPPRPITQYSPISPLIAQSSPNLFKKMIGKNLFASIQKGFDEYEATKTQREEVKERVTDKSKVVQ